MLRLEGVNAWYGDVQVLRDVSVEMDARSTMALLGANGAGKTTLLRCLCGLLARRSGAIWFKDERIDTLAAAAIVERGLIMVPEGRALFPFMTVEENLLLGGYARRARPDRGRTLERVYALLPRLRERRHQLGGSLSGGEQQMCAIARGLMAKPELLVLDEPSLGLSPLMVRDVFALVRQLRSEGMTVLLVEQHVRNALGMADRGAVLENGRVVLQGAGADLLNDPMLRKAYMGQKH
jgi:branched-chain amino acid transport system ATP-binding protein